MRESAAGSAAASRIGRINRFMRPHIHNLAIVAILSETGGMGGSAATAKAVTRSAIEIERPITVLPWTRCDIVRRNRIDLSNSLLVTSIIAHGPLPDGRGSGCGVLWQYAHR